MNTNWSKILLFSLLFLVLGAVIGHMITYHMMRGCHHGGCGMKESCGHGGGMHHGSGKGSCCAGGSHGHGEGRGHDDHGVHVIVHQLEEANFQGDTTIAIDGGSVNVKREGDKTEVRVEVRDSTEKTVTMEREEKH
jgi:hypothetical protein